MSLKTKVIGWSLHVYFIAALVMAGAKTVLIPAMGETHFFGMFGALCFISAAGLPAWYMTVFRDERADHHGDEMP